MSNEGKGVAVIVFTGGLAGCVHGLTEYDTVSAFFKYGFIYAAVTFIGLVALMVLGLFMMETKDETIQEREIRLQEKCLMAEHEIHQQQKRRVVVEEQDYSDVTDPDVRLALQEFDRELSRRNAERS